MQIEKTKEIGFCFGVKRALDLLEKAIRDYGEIETLGSVVHNQQVINNFSKLGVKIVENLDQLKGNVVVIPSHGVPPGVIEELKARRFGIIDTTCSVVQKAQMAAKKLSDEGFEVIVFGDPDHSEVKGMLGWAGGRGLATLDTEGVPKLDKLSHHLGFLAQTTRNSALFAPFVNNFISSFLPQIKELRIINTICAVTERRQAAALQLARKVNLMIVVGGRNSANTRCLADISSKATETRQVETAAEIEEGWLKGKSHIGITSGTSTSEQTIQEVMLKLEEIAGNTNGA